MPVAFDIYQTNLDRVSKALWRRDLATMLLHVALPNYLATLDREIVLSSKEDMCLAMTEFRDHLDRQGADAYRRVCRHAEFLDKAHKTIVGSHMTYILRDDLPVIEPFLSRMTLLKIDGLWKCAFVESDTTNDVCAHVAEDLADAQRAHHARLSGRNAS